MSAKPSATSPSPALRLGVVLGGTVVAEHLVRDHGAFTIGRGINADVQLPLTALPRRWELARLTPAGLVLRLGAGMDVRVSVDDAVWTRAECDARGQRAGDVTTITVPLTAHGRIELGEVRVLFQGVRAPARVAAPTLPRALRGTLADRIDGRVAALAAASLVVHLGVMLAARLNDPPADLSPAAQANQEYYDDTVAILDADDPLLAEPLPPTTSEPSPGTTPVATPTPTAPEPHAPSTPGPSRPTTRPGPTTPSLTPEADARRMADLLFASEGKTGDLLGDLSSRRVGTDLAQQLQEVADRDGTASIGDQSGRTIPTTEGPRIGTGQNPVLPGDPAQVTQTDKRPETSPPGRIDPIRPPRTPDGPDVDPIVSKIRSTYMTGLQRCYKKSLVTDPTLAGKLKLSFTVSDRGSVSDASASGVEGGLTGCVEGLMNGWRFTPVVDGDGDPTDADIKLVLQLRPT